MKERARSIVGEFVGVFLVILGFPDLPMQVQNWQSLVSQHVPVLSEARLKWLMFIAGLLISLWAFGVFGRLFGKTKEAADSPYHEKADVAYKIVDDELTRFMRLSKKERGKRAMEFIERFRTVVPQKIQWELGSKKRTLYVAIINKHVVSGDPTEAIQQLRTALSEWTAANTSDFIKKMSKDFADKYLSSTKSLAVRPLAPHNVGSPPSKVL